MVSVCSVSEADNEFSLLSSYLDFVKAGDLDETVTSCYRGSCRYEGSLSMQIRTVCKFVLIDYYTRSDSTCKEKKGRYYNFILNVSSCRSAFPKFRDGVDV